MTAAAKRLAGARVLITRSEDDSAEWAEELERRGARPVLLPCIRSEPIDTPELRAALSKAVASADWLVLTSRRGAEACARLLATPAETPRGGASSIAPRATARVTLADRTRVATVGAATADAANKLLGRAELLGGGNAAALGAALASDELIAAGASVVLALAANARDELEQVLAAAGARCTRFDVYRTIPRRRPRRNARCRRSAPSASCSRARRPRAVSCIKWISTCRSRSIRSGRRRRPRRGLSAST